MKKTIQVRISRGENFYNRGVLDLPVVTQAATLNELAFNLKETISLQLEGEDPAEFGIASDPSILAIFELELRPHA